MKLLILNTAILAAGDLTETTDSIHSSDAIYPKHVIHGWQIVDVAVPDGFTPAGYTWEGGQVVAKPPVVVPVAVPEVVSMRQARLALLAAGLLASVDATIAQAGGAAQIEWEYATEVRRDAPLVAQMGQMLSLDDAALDQLFITAAEL